MGHYGVDSPVVAVHRVTAIAKRESSASAAHLTHAIVTVLRMTPAQRDKNIERFLEFLRIRQPQAILGCRILNRNFTFTKAGQLLHWHGRLHTYRIGRLWMSGCGEIQLSNFTRILIQFRAVAIQP